MRFHPQTVIIILLVISCYVDASMIRGDHRGGRRIKGRQKQLATRNGGRRAKLRALDIRQRFHRTKRDNNAESEANVHSMLSETNSLAAAAESIQAAENSMAAGLEAEQSRKALNSRVPKSTGPQYPPPEPIVREFIPDGHPKTYDNDDDDYYYDDYEDYNMNMQNRRPPLPPLPPHPNQNGAQQQLRLGVQSSHPAQQKNANRNNNVNNAQKEGDIRSLNLQLLNQQQQQKQATNLARKEDIDLRKVFWLKVPDNLTDQTVHQKVAAVFGEVSSEGKDVLVIPVSREFNSSDEISDGFMKALGLRSALRRARKLRRLKMEFKELRM